MPTELFDLTGKSALITGSSQGIGYTLAEGLRQAGGQIVLNGRDAAKLGTAADALGGTALPFDVTDHGAARAAVDSYETDHGPIDILINNAGMQHRTPLEDFASEDFEHLLQTNVTSVFNGGQA